MIRFMNVLESLYKVKTNTVLMRKLLLIVAGEVIFYAGIFYLTYQALHFNVSYLSSLIVGSLSLYSLLIRITPASFGFYEATVVYTTKILNLSVANGLLVAMTTRIVNMVWVFILGPAFSYFMIIAPRRTDLLPKSGK